MNTWTNTTNLFDSLGILNYVRKLSESINKENVAKFTELYSAIYEEIPGCNKADYIEPVGEKTMATLMVEVASKYSEIKNFINSCSVY